MGTDEGGRPSWLRRALRVLGSGSSPERGGDGAHFRVLYDRFREILSLNDSMLQLIADLEDALSGRAPFSLEVMDRRVRKSAHDVFLMVKDLNQITGGKHPDLYDAIQRIHAELEAALATRPQPAMGAATIGLSELRVSSAPLSGMKMAVLGEVRAKVGLPVPDGFVITSAAFDRFMSANELWERTGRLETILEVHGPRSLAEACEEVRSAILRAPVPPELGAEILQRFDELAGSEPVRVAMRSSAVKEDTESSHAGQYHTQLHVERDTLLDAYRLVVASAYSPGAISYRFERGITSAESRMAVGCMRMVEARCSGILFSRPFESPGQDSVVISATQGLAAALASGEQSAEELLVIDGQPPASPAGCLQRHEVLALARIARELERYFDKPQDVEWAIDPSGTIQVLQSRPMSAARAQSSPALDIGSAELLLAQGGLVACPGAGAGPVCFVRSESDIHRFPEGGVLVAHHSSPTFSSVMKRCSAIVTEIGSPTGHMAILAREFDVPALVGLSDALSVLSEGQVVTVDATSRRIFAGDLAPSRKARSRPDRSAEGPVVHALRGAADLIAPLYLTDPLSIEFTPQRCRSLHDITRFVHEKVFEAMFHFGDLAATDHRRAIWLEARLPIRVAVYDLGGGLVASAAETGHATQTDVTSVPARAFLDGLTDPRIRWDQPRPVSARGFLSVLGAGIAGPPPEAQQVGRTSYTVISDRYMNFSTKAGYHFSTVDTWCGDSLNKNYIHFRFERGGASTERRRRRVEFLDRVLRSLDFRTHVRDDTLVARLQKYPRELIIARLTELGRLTLVSRQLDMLMDSDSSPAYFAEAFLANRFDSF